MTIKNKVLKQDEYDKLIHILQARFTTNMHRHEGVEWAQVQARLEQNPEKLWSLNAMEESGGEPDVVEVNELSGEFVFYDCSEESPKGRRSFCYDREALDTRKENKPKNNVLDSASSMGIELLNEEQYRNLQKLGKFDTKTSSWIQTPAGIREHGGAIFADFRYNHVFVYHNGASSYYAARGFRGLLTI